MCPRAATCRLDKKAHDINLVKTRLSRVERVILVMSNKGGVGKTTLAANLGVALARKGFQVGIADADIHGPNLAKLFGCEHHRLKLDEHGLPPFQYGTHIKIGSIAFMQKNPDEPIVWRDAYKYDFIHQLISSFNWQSLDFLLIDLPPGTGNESITIMDLVNPPTGVIIVTSPQEVALLDVRKSIGFARQRHAPILGIVENMSGVECPTCHTHVNVFPSGGVDDTCAELGIELLGRLPIFPAVATQSDCGQPIGDLHPDGPEAQAFQAIVERSLEKIEQRVAQ